MKRLRIRPVVGITMGDPVGVGPEVIVKALAQQAITDICIPLVLGDMGVIEQAMRVVGLPLVLNRISRIEDMKDAPNVVNVMSLSHLDVAHLCYGRPTTETGSAMVSYILEAVRLALGKRIEAVVTAPINKAAMTLAGYSYPGHTELLAEETKTHNYAMMLAGEKLKVVLVTIHHPLRQVPDLLTTEKIISTIRLTCQTVHDFFGIDSPAIAVAALNPHAGEEGLFGHEEQTVIIPALEKALQEGMAVQGPFPADSLFYHAAQGAYDAVVCMYHDQGLIPLKLLHFDDAVNVTLGLPIIRTSVDHGTAYDIAGSGQANPKSLMNAVQLAVRMALHKKHL